MPALSAPVVILEFCLAGQTHRVFVPESWSGRVGIHVNVHKGHPSRRFQVVKEETVDPTKDRPLS